MPITSNILQPMKFQPSALFSTNDRLKFWLGYCSVQSHFGSVHNWSKDVLLVKYSMYWSTLVSRCYARNLDGLGFDLRGYHRTTKQSTDLKQTHFCFVFWLPMYIVKIVPQKTDKILKYWKAIVMLNSC